MEANKVRKMKRRICLVLDCLCAHDFSDKTADLINLQHYVIKEKRLSEREAIVIFYDVVRVVEALHKVSCQLVLKSMWNQNCLFYLTTFLMALARSRSGVCYILRFPNDKIKCCHFSSLNILFYLEVCHIAEVKWLHITFYIYCVIHPKLSWIMVHGVFL